MHLFNSPVSLMTQTNWHEPCHLGTHCPSDENGCGTALEAPHSLCLRAEKIKRHTCIPESVHLKKSQVISSINLFDKPWKAMRARSQSSKMTTTTSGVLSLTVTGAYLWGQWTSQYYIIALIHAFIQWQFVIWDWRCSPSNLQMHSELLLHSHFPKQAR